jgi:hypothetical protein
MGIGLRRPGQLARAFTVLLVLTAMLTTGAAQAGRPGDAGPRTWKIESTPNPVAADISVLASVSCPYPGVCIAVGSSAQTLSTPTVPLAERWNGKHWRIQRMPAPTGSSDTLYGVSCSSARACMAVGTAFYKVGRRTTTLAEEWNGTSWRVLATPAISGPAALYSVSCTSPMSCMAVGHTSDGRHAVVERWDGTTWRIQAIPQAARSTQFAGVSCPTARACTAVGYQNNGHARPSSLSWNGTAWRVQAVPLPHGAPVGMFEAVSCTSPRACTATGTDFDPRSPTLAERWNGRIWRVERTPNPPDYRGSFSSVDLDGVACTSATACTASGEYSLGAAAAYFLESWNGTRWRLDAAPHPAGFAHGALLGISCSSARCPESAPTRVRCACRSPWPWGAELAGSRAGRAVMVWDDVVWGGRKTDHPTPTIIEQ